MEIDLQKRLKEIFVLNSRGYINSRESSSLEFKQAFSWGSKDLYMKIMVSFANNKGGFIIFGIQDSPKSPIGLLNDKFENTTPEQVSEYLKSTFSTSFDFEMGHYEFDNKKFGYIYVYNTKNKPILCIRNRGDVLFDGDIIYRNGARSEKIDSQNLIRLLNENIENERKDWQKLLGKISRIGVQNSALLNLENGEIEENGGKIIIDDNILEKITFIKEGQFSEKEGAPTLRLIGEIKESSEVIEREIKIEVDPGLTYIYSTKDIGKELGFIDKNATSNGLALIKYFGFQKNGYMFEFNISKTNKPKKYSQKCLDELKKKLEDGEFIIDPNSYIMKEIRKDANKIN